MIVLFFRLFQSCLIEWPQRFQCPTVVLLLKNVRKVLRELWFGKKLVSLAVTRWRVLIVAAIKEDTRYN